MNGSLLRMQLVTDYIPPTNWNDSNDFSRLLETRRLQGNAPDGIYGTYRYSVPCPSCSGKYIPRYLGKWSGTRLVDDRYVNGFHFCFRCHMVNIFRRPSIKLPPTEEMLEGEQSDVRPFQALSHLPSNCWSPGFSPFVVFMTELRIWKVPPELFPIFQSYLCCPWDNVMVELDMVFMGIIGLKVSGEIRDLTASNLLGISRFHTSLKHRRNLYMRVQFERQLEMETQWVMDDYVSRRNKNLRLQALMVDMLTDSNLFSTRTRYLQHRFRLDSLTHSQKKELTNNKYIDYPLKFLLWP